VIKECVEFLQKTTCFGCGQTGHLRSQCPVNPSSGIRCFRCGGIGHRIEVCPTKPGRGGSREEEGILFKRRRMKRIDDADNKQQRKKGRSLFAEFGVSPYGGTTTYDATVTSKTTSSTSSSPKAVVLGVAVVASEHVESKSHSRALANGNLVDSSVSGDGGPSVLHSKEKQPHTAAAVTQQQQQPVILVKVISSNQRKKRKKKKRKKHKSRKDNKTEEQGGGGALALLSGYGSDDSEET